MRIGILMVCKRRGILVVYKRRSIYGGVHDKRYL